MFIAALFVIARNWKQSRCPSTEEWIEKMWYIYTMEYDSAEKENGILKFAGKWMDLEEAILIEGFSVALETVLELALVDQTGLELTEIRLPLPPECWD
ncbi:protein of unknown function DUF1725 containing protein [Cricetulus griseus]|nr:protein of unknown function DUF1725 containing protein [Cricetulus griseus]